MFLQGAWASPVIIVPKKSALGEPPKRHMCVDFRKLNKIQPEVMTGGKGCISLVPLPKIDELYAKLKGFKGFKSFFHFRLMIRVLSHWTVRKCKTKNSICNLWNWKIPVQQSPIWTSQCNSIFPKINQGGPDRL